MLISGDEFFNHKKENEHLGIIKVSVRDLNFWVNFRNFQDYIKNYLSYGVNSNFPRYTKFEDTNDYKRYETIIKNYVKTVWLTDEYLNNGQEFKNPLGLNWDIPQKLWNIHPGGSRNFVIYFFPREGKEYMTGVGFNTGGYNGVSFQTVFNSVSDIKNYFKNDDIALSTTIQQGNLIPHVHIDNGLMQYTINDYEDRIRNFYQYTKIESNFNMKKWGYDESLLRKEKQRIRVIVDNKKNKDEISRAFLLMPIRDTFDNFGVKIEKLS